MDCYNLVFSFVFFRRIYGWEGGGGFGVLGSLRGAVLKTMRHLLRLVKITLVRGYVSFHNRYDVCVMYLDLRLIYGVNAPILRFGVALVDNTKW